MYWETTPANMRYYINVSGMKTAKQTNINITDRNITYSRELKRLKQKKQPKHNEY